MISLYGHLSISLGIVLRVLVESDFTDINQLLHDIHHDRRDWLIPHFLIFS